jgi:RNA polymerase sigma-70 factor (ECF subfamily)
VDESAAKRGLAEAVNPGEACAFDPDMDAFATLACATAELATDTTQDNAGALEAFLAAVERKAFRMAQIALRDADDALDAVQDAMLQLVRRYGSRPAQEWKPLFYRILENRVRDQYRRRSVRNRVLAWFPRRVDDGADEPDPIAEACDPTPGPEAQIQSGETLAALEAALRRLPGRQRQAFLLRNFEGLDVAGTALAMGCSEGSVKTHYFRAVRALRGMLGDFES